MHEYTFEKLNFKEKYASHYDATQAWVVEVKTHPFNYLSISWKGHPETSKEFNKAIQLLEGLVFTIKFKLKGNPPEGFFDFDMPPSESERKDVDGKKEDWKWKVSIPVPNFITEEKVVHTRRVAQAKSEEKLSQVKFFKGKEKHVIQILLIWAYHTSKRSINKLHSYAKKNWLEIKGNYQELYLNDMRRTKPDKLETIIRLEVKKAKATGKTKAKKK